MRLPWDKPEFPFFCHICGVPPSWRRMLSSSTLKVIDPERNQFDHRDYEYQDYALGQQDLGYDARLLHSKKLRWLMTARLVTNKIADTVRDIEAKAEKPLLSPLAVFVEADKGLFIYPDGTNVLRCNVDGYLMHDTCFKMLERAHQHVQGTCSAQTRGLDLGRLWEWMERGLSDRNHNWGFGDAFDGADNLYPGMKFDESYLEWISLKGSMWTVMDPEGPFDGKPLLDRAAASPKPGYTFTFSIKPSRSEPKPNANILSSLLRELQLHILELLPTQSVLDLFLASPDFRLCAENLPSSFWKSRLYFDVPWCADIILSQIQTSRATEPQKGASVQFDSLLPLLKGFL